MVKVIATVWATVFLEYVIASLVWYIKNVSSEFFSLENTLLKTRDQDQRIPEISLSTVKKKIKSHL